MFQQGKSQEAVAALEKALAVDPKHGKAHNNLALAAIDLGELEEAEAHYRESLAIEPQPAIYNDLGFVLERQGMTEEAAELYRKSLELDPESASAHFNLAASLARRGEFAEAERHFRAALEQSPNAQTYTGLGFVLWQQGRVDEGHRQAARRDQGRPEAAGGLRPARDDPGRAGNARGSRVQLSSPRPHPGPSAAAHQKLAQVLMRLGRTDEARKEMEMAKALDRNSGEAR